MKAVIQDFDRQTSQRFDEYNERMIKNRQKCKEQCKKDIQKIILKDKIEKDLTKKFVTLETNISTVDIPTCVCEKTVADKVEKTCLKCGKNLGGFVPGLGFLGAYGAHSIVQVAMESAKELAIQMAIEDGKDAGIEAVIQSLSSSLNADKLCGSTLNTVLNGNNYNDINFLVNLLKEKYNTICGGSGPDAETLLCYIGSDNPKAAYTVIETNVPTAVTSGTEAATSKTTEMTTIYTTQELSKVTSTGAILSNPIIISFIVIVIIVIIFLIIYLILRYRRKKQMKKKLKYIKLLKE
ncbi:PIR protein, putative [Plasmodium sp. gorilla clade G1]|nr:PIR protein, putative [Plasmodium sp. gorilla clade G1]